MDTGVTGVSAARPVRLFVYGSLRPGWPGEPGVDDPAIARLKAAARWVGAGTAAGRLWRISWHPGMTAGRDRVVGDVLEFVEPGLLEALDAYEDSSGDGLYVRRKVRVTLDAEGRRVWAWVWVYAGPTEGLRRIADGDFLADLRRAP